MAEEGEREGGGGGWRILMAPVKVAVSQSSFCFPWIRTCFLYAKVHVSKQAREGVCVSVCECVRGWKIR